MPAFTAINVEPEESIEDQVDNTRELHIDEALKRFQIALKLHAQGPEFFDEATRAYDELFNSDIFKYPQALTEYERQQSGAITSSDSFDPEFDLPSGDAENTAYSLSQTFYLSHKNRGLLAIDRIKHGASHSELPREDVYNQDDAVANARNALYDLSAALDQDPSDADLWRKVARVGASLESARIKRYCLEAAIELDDDPTVVEVVPPSLAEALAGEQLKEQLALLGDGVALSHPIMNTWVKKRMPAVLRRHLDPIPFLPDPTASLLMGRRGARDIGPDRAEIAISTPSWSDIGKALFGFMQSNGLSSKVVAFELLSGQGSAPDDDQDGESDDVEMGNLESPAQAAATDGSAQQELDGKSLSKDDLARHAAPEAAANGKNADNPSRRGRKRSQSVAGIPDAPEETTVVEKRSKRIRRRDTAVEDAPDSAAMIAERLAVCKSTDQNLFDMTLRLLRELGVDDPDLGILFDKLLHACRPDERTAEKLPTVAMSDLRRSIIAFKDDAAKVLLRKEATNQGAADQAQESLVSFLDHAKARSQDATQVAPFDDKKGARRFLSQVNDGWMTCSDVAFEWVLAMSGFWVKSKWPEAAKTAFCKLNHFVHREIHSRVRQGYDSLQGGPDRKAVARLDGLVQVLFELHLDSYAEITQPASIASWGDREEVKGRLRRWQDLATERTQLRDGAPDHALTARFLCASVFSSTTLSHSDRDHTLRCWAELSDYLAQHKCAPIALPNSIVIPTVSPAAADREISKLTTMDFFITIFQHDHVKNPIHVIDTLEPVLNPGSVLVTADEPPADCDATARTAKKVPLAECASQRLKDIWKFLDSSSTELRLFLWSRLGDAYGQIDYKTKQFSCHLRSIEMLMSELDSDAFTHAAEDTRRALLMHMLRYIDEPLGKALGMAVNENTAFDIVDGAHIQSTASKLARFSALLHVCTAYDDETRAGMTQAPSSATFNAFLAKLREMQVRAWCLQYSLLKVGISQRPSAFSDRDAILADYLAAVHRVLGLRKYCKVSNKIFVNIMRIELTKLKHIDRWEDYIGQVLFDLFGLKLGGSVEIQDHGCVPDKINRRQTVQLVEKVVSIAGTMPMKDLLKSDLKTAIENMQQSIGQPKTSPQMVHNMRNFTEQLKKPINPLRLFLALSSKLSIDVIDVNSPETPVAKHGWFFLLGMIALARFKLADLKKRQTPGATDDLRLGATFLKLQLQFTPEKWDAWFRLGECFDYELEDAVLWTADKMNKDRAELTKLQRSAIHCYTLALSHSLGEESASFEDGDPLYDLYCAFGMRMYASSREPFAMEPFFHAEKRVVLDLETNCPVEKPTFGIMTDFQVWKYAAALFRRAIRRRPREWRNHFMLAKCLWKMYNKDEEGLSHKDLASKPDFDRIVDPIEKAIELAVALPRTRHTEVILEPHYKMVSVVNKLVLRGDMPAQQGAEILSRQPFGIGLSKDGDSIRDLTDWEEYIIKSLRMLRDRDRSGWHHRIIMRHAKVVFNNESLGDDTCLQAKGAFNVLRESMVTKTMVVNVWKCDAERPGRHHVYTERYARFVVRLLMALGDRANFEMLLRRLRKKGADYYHFGELWGSCCRTYLHLLRKTYRIPSLPEDHLRGVYSDEFDVAGNRIGEYLVDPAKHTPAFECMKDAIELKKLNSNLMKVAPIDDLICDCYGSVYFEIGHLVQPPDTEMAEAPPAPPALPPPLEPVPLRPEQSLELRPANQLLVPTNGDRDAATSFSVPDSAPRTTRKAGIRRPEVLRKAELVVNRSMEPPKSAGLTKTRSIGSRSESSGKRDSRTPNPENGNADGEEEENEDEGEGEGEDEDAETKDGNEGDDEATLLEGLADAPGPNTGAADDDAASVASNNSAQHWADDESDLSDAPDPSDDDEAEEDEGLLFTRLKTGGAMVPSADASADDNTLQPEPGRAMLFARPRRGELVDGAGIREALSPDGDNNELDEEHAASSKRAAAADDIDIEDTRAYITAGEGDEDEEEDEDEDEDEDADDD